MRAHGTVRGWAIALVTLVLVVGCDGSAGTHAYQVPAGVATSQIAATAPATYGAPPPTRLPTALPPKGDAFSECGEVNEGILVAKYVLEDDGFGVTWWRSDREGFVWSAGFDGVIREGCAPWVEIGSPAGRQALIAYWRDLAYAARVTGVDDKTSDVTNVFVCQDPPSGYYWQYGGQVRDAHLRMPGEGASRNVSFGNLERVDRQGAELVLTYRDGATETGVPEPYFYTVEFVPRLCGIQQLPDERLVLWELPLEQVLAIEFLSAPKIAAP